MQVGWLLTSVRALGCDLGDMISGVLFRKRSKDRTVPHSKRTGFAVSPVLGAVVVVMVVGLEASETRMIFGSTMKKSFGNKKAETSRLRAPGIQLGSCQFMERTETKLSGRPWQVIRSVPSTVHGVEGQTSHTFQASCFRPVPSADWIADYRLQITTA